MSNAIANSKNSPHTKTSVDLVTRFGPFTLRPHQVDACNVMLRDDQDGLLLYYDMGSGKTLTSLAAGVNLIIQGIVNRVVCAVPKAVIDQFKGQLQDMRLSKEMESRFTFTTHASLKNSRITPETLLVLDEAHLFRSGDGPQFSEALQATMDAGKVLAMTGTPLVNSPADIAPVIAFVDLTKTFNMLIKHIDESEFLREMPQFKRDPVGYVSRKLLKTSIAANEGGPEISALTTTFNRTFMINVGLNPNTIDELKDYLKCTMLYYAPDTSSNSYRDLYPSTTTRVVRVPMTVQQTKKHIDVAMKINGDDGDEAREAYLSKTRRQGTFMYSPGDLGYDVNRQGRKKSIELGTYISRQRKAKKHLHSIDVPIPQTPKLQNILDLTKQYTTKGQKVVIYSVWTTQVLTIMRTMLRRAGISFRTIDGNVTDDAREKAKTLYNNDEIQVLLLSKAAQVGLDLKNTSAVMIVEPDWNEANIQQAIARAVRAGSHDGKKVPRHVDIYKFISTFSPDVPLRYGKRMATKTADEHLYELSLAKSAANTEMLRIMQQVSNNTVRECQ